METLVRRRALTEMVYSNLTFTALSAGTFTYHFANTEGYGQKTIYYKKNNGVFNRVDFSAGGTVNIDVEAGDVVEWMGASFIDTYTTSNLVLQNYSHFSSTANFNVSGDVCSLNNHEKELINKSGFAYLFKDCTTLIDASEMVFLSTYAANYRDTNYSQYESYIDHTYYGMFWGCTSLQKASFTLNLRIIGFYSYACMFYGCTSLQYGPNISANGMAGYAFYRMFYNCPNLLEAPDLSGIKELYDSDGLGRLGRGDDSIFKEMFYGCTKIAIVKIYQWLYYGINGRNGHYNNPHENWLTGAAETGVVYYKTGSQISTASAGYGTNALPDGWESIKA